MKIYGIYTGVWLEGNICTVAGVCTERKSITEIEVSRVGDDYEHHERDFFQVEHDRKFYELECEDGDLTENGVKQFEAFLLTVAESSTSPAAVGDGKNGRVSFLEIATVEVTEEAFSQIKKEFDLFTRCDVDNEIILDTSCFEGVELDRVASTLHVGVDDISTRYVLIFHEGRSWSETEIY